MFDQPPEQIITEQTAQKIEREILDFMASHDRLRLFRAETGTGKSLGIRSYLEKGTDLRIAILVYSINEINELWERLEAALPTTKICGWSKDHDQKELNTSTVYKRTYKEDLRSAQIAIVTHAFISAGNKHYLGDRDLYLVDENPSWDKFDRLKPEDFTKAIDRLNASNTATNRDKYAALTGMMQTMEPELDFTPMSDPLLSSMAESIRALARDIDSQNHSGLSREQKRISMLSEAIQHDRAVLCKAGNLMQHNEGYTVHISYLHEDPLLTEKVVIFSATAHLGGYTALGSKSLPSTVSVNYQNLEIVKLRYPNINKQSKQLTTSDKGTVTSIVDQIIRQTTGDLLVIGHRSWHKWITKSVYENHVFYKEENPNYEKMSEIQLVERKIFFTYHGKDVGSNRFRTCKEVIYLGLFYTAKEVDVMGTLYHINKAIDATALEGAQGKGLTSHFATYRRNKLMEEFKQMLARGHCREINPDGIAKPMRAWVMLNKAEWLYEKVQSLFPFCKVGNQHSIKYPEALPTKSSEKVIETLQRLPREKVNITVTELEALIKTKFGTGPTLRNHSKDISTWIQGTGWKYEAGRRGKGNEAKFVRR